MKKNEFRNESGVLDEHKLLEELKRKDIQAFARFHSEYSNDLLIFAFTLLEDAPLAIKKVDELFLSMWEENKLDNIELPIYNYLCQELRKLCNPGKHPGY